jgi:leucyl aminopeptidase
MLPSWLTLFLSAAQPAQARLSGSSNSLSPSDHGSDGISYKCHAVDETILQALAQHADPVDALLSLRPDRQAEMAEPRLLHVQGEAHPTWLTEGDKLRLRRRGMKFMDITNHNDF